MENVKIIEHPLIIHKTTLLRDKNTGSKEFRELVREIATLMCYEATRDLPLKEIEIETPIAVAKSKVISGRKTAFIAVLRAGLVMVDGVVSLVPAAKIGHIGLYRDPKTMEAVQYFCKLPFDIDERDVIILDALIGTGSCAVEAINIVKAKGVKNIKYMCVLAAPEGVKAINDAHPDVTIYCAEIDKGLNEKGYIVPGLGDAGDRIFGTK